MSKNTYNRERRRNAEFIRPPHPLKAKVGGGGISDHVLDRAQKLLEQSDDNFRPQAEMYLNTMTKGIQQGLLRIGTPEEAEDPESIIAMIIYPAVQLRANGGLFNFPLISAIAEKLIRYIEVVEQLDQEVLEIVTAFQTTMRAILAGPISGDGGKYGQELLKELDEVCRRYFEKRQ